MIDKVKQLIKTVIGDTDYFIHTSILRSKCFKVHSISVTIDEIVDRRCSVVRYGDGEIQLINGNDIRFQEHNRDLSKRLQDILVSDEDGLLVCIPDIFTSVDQYEAGTKAFWKYFLFKTRRTWNRFLSTERVYYNAFLSRPYIFFREKNNSAEWFASIKRIWTDRKVLLIEGKESRLGVGNDLFDNVSSLERILCPAKHAYRKFNSIRDETIKRAENDTLIMVSLGPTAVPLVYEMFQRGYQAIDIGHIDIEYEWFLRGVKEKVGVENKHVNEVADEHDVSECLDEQYLRQVVAVIS